MSEKKLKHAPCAKCGSSKQITEYLFCPYCLTHRELKPAPIINWRRFSEEKPDKDKLIVSFKINLGTFKMTTFDGFLKYWGESDFKNWPYWCYWDEFKAILPQEEGE